MAGPILTSYCLFRLEMMPQATTIMPMMTACMPRPMLQAQSTPLALDPFQHIVHPILLIPLDHDKVAISRRAAGDDSCG